jgi:hypothetical protein
MLSPLLLLILAGAAAAAMAAQAEQPPITRPGCPDKCGNVSIPFPFGLMPGCFRDGFELTCDHNFDPPRLFVADNEDNRITLTERDISVVSDDASYLSYLGNITYFPVELIDISVDSSEARAYFPITSACGTNSTQYVVKQQAMALAGAGPFAVSLARNVVVGVGWRVAVADVSRYNELACRSELPGGRLEAARNGSCDGRGCCEAALVSEYGYAAITDVEPGLSLDANALWRSSPCSYAMVVEKSRYAFSTPDLYGDGALTKRFPNGVPVSLDFAVVGDATACPAKGQRPPPDYACVSGNSYCVNASVGQSGYGLSVSYVCKCSEHYEGNPYIANGCRGICRHAYFFDSQKTYCLRLKISVGYFVLSIKFVLANLFSGLYCSRRRRLFNSSFPSFIEDIDECKFPDVYHCASNGICKNRLGGYDCPCKPGTKGDGKLGQCAEKFPLVAKVIVGKSYYFYLTIKLQYNFQNK